MKLKRPTKKTLLYVLLAMMLVCFASLFGGVQYLKYQFFNADPNTLTFEGTLQTIPFNWAEVQFGDHVEPHYAMRVPVTMPGVETKFYMQFDTGSPYTFLRSGAIDAFNAHGIEIETFDKDGETSVKKFELNVAGNQIYLDPGWVKERTCKINWEDPEAINIIGTIGADFIENKICAIDFPANEIRLYSHRTKELDSLGTFTPFSFEGRRVMLPVEIAGVDQHLFYDSGCSSFGLFTSKYHFDRFADLDSAGVSYNSSRHGDPIPVHHQTSDIAVKFGEADVPLTRVSYVEQYVGLQSYLGGFIDGGVLGNECLTERTLILDTVNDEYLMVDGSIRESVK